MNKGTFLPKILSDLPAPHISYTTQKKKSPWSLFKTFASHSSAISWPASKTEATTTGNTTLPPLSVVSFVMSSPLPSPPLSLVPARPASASISSQPIHAYGSIVSPSTRPSARPERVVVHTLPSSLSSSDFHQTPRPTSLGTSDENVGRAGNVGIQVVSACTSGNSSNSDENTPPPVSSLENNSRNTKHNMDVGSARDVAPGQLDLPCVLQVPLIPPTPLYIANFTVPFWKHPRPHTHHGAHAQVVPGSPLPSPCPLASSPALPSAPSQSAIPAIHAPIAETSPWAASAADQHVHSGHGPDSSGKSLHSHSSSSSCLVQETYGGSDTASLPTNTIPPAASFSPLPRKTPSLATRANGGLTNDDPSTPVTCTSSFSIRSLLPPLSPSTPLTPFDPFVFAAFFL